MLIKGLFVAGLSGKAGGLVASHGRSGSYFRTLVKPVDPGTIYQTAVRNIMGNLASAWVDHLDAVQRAAWDLYGSNVAVTNRVGDTIYLTGLNWYIACNVPRIQVGENTLDDAPTIFSMASFTLPTWQVDEAGQESSLAYTNTDDWATTTGGFLMISMSRPQNPTINYFKGPYRWLDHELGVTGTPPTSPLVSDVLFPVVEDQRVFAIVRCANSDGRISPPVRLFADVIA